MHVAAHDQGYVEAAATSVYGALADAPGYPRWWRDARWDGRLALRLGGRAAFHARAERHRPDVGLVLALGGPRTGSLEWHLEPLEDGTIVNAILNLHLTGGRRRSERGLMRARIRIHRGLVGLKHALEATP
jgi:uncharacterized protein YndB with AHSA1/START domain